MRIAIDATPLSCGTGSGPRVGGLARYTSQLVEALVHEFPDDEFILVSDQAFNLPCEAPNLRAGRRPDNLWERRWWTFGLQRELKRQEAQVFHGVNFAVPFPATMPAVMTIHDLSPWVDAAWVTGDWRVRSARVRKRVPWMIRTGAATHVITPSEAIRREVQRFFRVDPGRVTAIPLAAAPNFHPRQVPQPMPSRGRPYFLYAGMFEPRKNVALVIAAWADLRARCEVDLVIAGPHREETPVAQHRPGLHLRGVVSDDELAVLYSGAIALVYPSHYEGFGLPVLEAMQCGTPVIISTDPALVETAGDAGMQETTEVGLRRAMQSLVENHEFRGEMSCRSLARASHFSWDRTARATREVYRSILAE